LRLDVDAGANFNGLIQIKHPRRQAVFTLETTRVAPIIGAGAVAILPLD
jgi:hypothetical protein